MNYKSQNKLRRKLNQIRQYQNKCYKYGKPVTPKAKMLTLLQAHCVQSKLTPTYADDWNDKSPLSKSFQTRMNATMYAEMCKIKTNIHKRKSI